MERKIKQTKLEEELEQEIYGLRLLVIAECREETCGGKGHFHQVMLNQKSFKKVSDACFTGNTEQLPDGLQRGYVNLGLQRLPLEPFEGMTDINHD